MKKFEKSNSEKEILKRSDYRKIAVACFIGPHRWLVMLLIQPNSFLLLFFAALLSSFFFTPTKYQMIELVKNAHLMCLTSIIRKLNPTL